MADDKITGFLSKDTAGLPNWAWILVVGAGIAAVYILPKFFPGTSSNASSSTGATDTSGLGLAIDPTTGLPYAVEGLSASGGLAGSGSVITNGSPPPPPAPPGGTLPPPIFQGPPQTPGGLSGMVRQALSGDPWDAAHTGVPIRSAPGGQGAIIGYVPWGSALSFTGSAQGSVNQQGGSTNWLQTTFNGLTGYVSAADVNFNPTLPPSTVLSSAMPARVVTSPQWPGQTQQIRMAG